MRAWTRSSSARSRSTRAMGRCCSATQTMGSGCAVSARRRADPAGTRANGQERRVGGAGAALHRTGRAGRVGHPGRARSDIPILGLIRSSDGGRMWTPVAGRGSPTSTRCRFRAKPWLPLRATRPPPWLPTTPAAASSRTPRRLRWWTWRSIRVAFALAGEHTERPVQLGRRRQKLAPRETLPNIRLVWPASRARFGWIRTAWCVAAPTRARPGTSSATWRGRRTPLRLPGRTCSTPRMWRA